MVLLLNGGLLILLSGPDIAATLCRFHCISRIDMDAAEIKDCVFWLLYSCYVSLSALLTAQLSTKMVEASSVILDHLSAPT